MPFAVSQAMKLAAGMLVILMRVLVTSGPATAEWYAWQDPSGTLHVTDQFAHIPSEVRGAAVTLPYGQLRRRASRVVETGTASVTTEFDSLRAALARREARLVTRQAHLQLLRASLVAPTVEQLRMENLLESEIQAETAAVAELHQTLDGGPR